MDKMKAVFFYSVGRWGLALAVSLILHVVVLGGLWLLRGVSPTQRNQRALETMTVQFMQVPSAPLLASSRKRPTLPNTISSPAWENALPAKPLPAPPAQASQLLLSPAALLQQQLSAPKANTPPVAHGALTQQKPFAKPKASSHQVPEKKNQTLVKSNFLTRLRQRVTQKTEASNQKQPNIRVQAQLDAQARQQTEQSVLALRIFTNRVREKVKQNYHFPAEFPQGIQAVVQIVIARDGTKQSIQLVQSSGHARFDRLVCLNRIRDATLPPIPSDVTEETVRLTLTCKP